MNKTKAPLAHGPDSISLANAEWQAQDRRKQQTLGKLDPMLGFLQLAESVLHKQSGFVPKASD